MNNNTVSYGLALLFVFAVMALAAWLVTQGHPWWAAVFVLLGGSVKVVAGSKEAKGE